MSGGTSERPGGSPSPRRGPRRGAGVLAVVAGVLLEVLLLAAVAVLYLVGLAESRAASPVLTVGTAVMALALAALLVSASRGLLRGHRWGRAPVLVWQVLQLLVSLQLVAAVGATSRTGVIGLALAVLGLAVGVGVLSPPVVRATSEPRRPDEQAPDEQAPGDRLL